MLAKQFDTFLSTEETSPFCCSSAHHADMGRMSLNPTTVLVLLSTLLLISICTLVISQYQLPKRLTSICHTHKHHKINMGLFGTEKQWYLLQMTPRMRLTEVSPGMGRPLSLQKRIRCYKEQGDLLYSTGQCRKVY